MASGSYGLAEELISELVNLYPADARYRNTYSQLLAFQNKLKEALVHSKAAVQLEPYEALYENNLGVTYGLMREYQNARDSLEKAVDLNPSSAVATANLSESFYNLGHHKEAYNLINSYIADYPNNPDPLEKLIHFSSVENNIADALRYYIKFIEIKFDKNFISGSQLLLKEASNFLLNFKSSIHTKLAKSPFDEESFRKQLLSLIDDLSEEDENKSTYKKLMSKYKKGISPKLFNKISELSGSIDLGIVTHSDYEIIDRGFE